MVVAVVTATSSVQDALMIYHWWGGEQELKIHATAVVREKSLQCLIIGCIVEGGDQTAILTAYVTASNWGVGFATPNIVVVA